MKQINPHDETDQPGWEPCKWDRPVERREKSRKWEKLPGALFQLYTFCFSFTCTGDALLSADDSPIMHNLYAADAPMMHLMQLSSTTPKPPAVRCKKQGRFVCWQIQLPTGAVHSTSLTLACTSVISQWPWLWFHTLLLFWRLPLWLWLRINGWSWKLHGKLGGEGMQIQLLTNQWQIFHLFHFPEPAPSFSVIFFRIDISLPSGYLNQKIPDLVFWSPLTSASGSIQSLLTHHFALHSQIIPGLCCSGVLYKTFLVLWSSKL